MNIFERILSWLGLPQPVTSQTPQNDEIHRLIGAGQRAKHIEDYPLALDFYDQAIALAQSQHLNTIRLGVSLFKAEVMIEQGALEDAERLLWELYPQAEKTVENSAYALVNFGRLEQAKGETEIALSYYERAQQSAQKAHMPGAEGRALGFMAGIYLAQDNASYALHLLPQAIHKINSAGDMEYNSLFFGYLGQAKIASGNEAEGEKDLRSAIHFAEVMQNHRMERHWRLVLGNIMMKKPQFDEAYKQFKHALPLFKNYPDKALHIRTLVSLTRASLHFRNVGESLHYAQTAMSLNAGDPELLPEIQAITGVVLHAKGDHEEAIEHLQAALKHLRTAEIVRNIAAAQHAIRHDAEAEKHYREALALAAAEGDTAQQARTHVRLGLFYSERYKMQAAIEEWQAALQLYQQLRYHAQVASLYCDIGNARKYLGQGARAIKEYEAALMALNSVDDIHVRGVVLSNAANAYTYQGDVESAEAFFNESIAIATRTEDRVAEAVRRGNYGWLLLMTGREQQAVNVLENALRISKEEKLIHQSAVQTTNLGLAHQHLGNWSAALTYHERALNIIQGVPSVHWVSIIRINLANALIGQGQAEQALPYLAEALATGRQYQDLEVIAQALIGQSRAALALGNPTDAVAPLGEALPLCRKSDMRHQLAEALQVSSELQAAQGDFTSAQAQWQEASQLFTLLRMTQATAQPAWLNNSV